MKIILFILSLMFSLICFSQENSFNDKLTKIDATDGLHEHYVRVKWLKLEGDNTFKVFRSTSAEMEIKEELGLSRRLKLKKSFLFDYDVIPGKHYYYTVKALQDDNSTLESLSDLGFIPKPPPIASPVSLNHPSNYYALERKEKPFGFNAFKDMFFEWSNIKEATQYHLIISKHQEPYWDLVLGIKADVVIDTIISSNSFLWKNTPSEIQKITWTVKAIKGNEGSYFTEPVEVLRSKAYQYETPNYYGDLDLRKGVAKKKKSSDNADLYRIRLRVANKTKFSIEKYGFYMFWSENDSFDRLDYLIDSHFEVGIGPFSKRTINYYVDLKVLREEKGGYLIVVPAVKEIFQPQSALILEIEK